MCSFNFAGLPYFIVDDWKDLQSYNVCASITKLVDGAPVFYMKVLADVCAI